jgi:hypothetical protein
MPPGPGAPRIKKGFGEQRPSDRVSEDIIVLVSELTAVGYHDADEIKRGIVVSAA